QAGVVDRLERLCQLHTDEHRPLWGQSLLAVDECPQIQAVNPLHGQVQPAILLAGIKYRDHVRMVNGGGKPCLPQETRAVVARLGDFRTDYLKRYGPAENPLFSPVDKAHPTRAHQLGDVVPAEGLASVQLRTHKSHPYMSPRTCRWRSAHAPLPRIVCRRAHRMSSESGKQPRTAAVRPSAAERDLSTKRSSPVRADRCRNGLDVPDDRGAATSRRIGLTSLPIAAGRATLPVMMRVAAAAAGSGRGADGPGFSVLAALALRVG